VPNREEHLVFGPDGLHEPVDRDIRRSATGTHLGEYGHWDEQRAVVVVSSSVT
jgi:hypothetical protein